MKKTLAIAILFASAALAQVAHAANPLVGTWKNNETGNILKITPKGLPDVSASNCGEDAFLSEFTQVNKSSIKKELSKSLNKTQAQKLLKQLPEGLVSAYNGVCGESYSTFYIAKPDTLIGVFCEVEDCSSATFRKVK